MDGIDRQRTDTGVEIFERACRVDGHSRKRRKKAYTSCHARTSIVIDDNIATDTRFELPITRAHTRLPKATGVASSPGDAQHSSSWQLKFHRDLLKTHSACVKNRIRLGGILDFDILSSHGNIDGHYGVTGHGVAMARYRNSRA